MRLESEIQRKINIHLICTLNPLAWRLTLLGRVLSTRLCLVPKGKWTKLVSFEKVSSVLLQRPTIIHGLRQKTCPNNGTPQSRGSERDAAMRPVQAREQLGTRESSDELVNVR